MLSEKEKRVLSLIDENQDEITETLQKLIRFKTITPAENEKTDSEDYNQLQDFIYGTLEGMGFELDIWEVDAAKLGDLPVAGVAPDRDLSNMPVVAGKLKGREKGRSLILNGHYDVVPPGLLENWSHGPFAGEVDGNKIFGRGACDMKGGIAAMLEALKSIQRAGIRLNGDLIVETVPEEEMTNMGTLSCCVKGYKADAAIIPEPTNLNVLVAVRGNLSGEITVFGRAGHADLIQPHWREGGAVNAISKAVKIIQALEELTNDWRNRPDKRHRYLDPDTIVPTLIKGGNWLITYPEKVQIAFTSNYIPGTVKNIKREIEEKIKSVADADPWMKQHPPQLETDWVYGAEIDEHEPIVQTGIEAAKELGFEPKLVGWGTLSDANHLINYMKIPTISIGPDDHTAHSADEFVSIDQLVATTKILSLAILRWCGG